MLALLLALTAWATPIADCPDDGSGVADFTAEGADAACARRPTWWHEGPWHQIGLMLGIGPSFLPRNAPVVFALTVDVERGWRKVALRARAGATGGGSTVIPFAYGGEIGFSAVWHLKVADEPWWPYPTYEWDRSHFIGFDASIGRLFNETRFTGGLVGGMSFLHLQMRANASLLYSYGRRGDWTDLVGPALGAQLTLSLGLQTRRPHYR